MPGFAKRGLALGYLAILIFLVARVYPLPNPALDLPFPADPAPLFTRAPHGMASALYRGNAQRTGLSAERGPRGLRATLLVPDWNPGVHNASKSSPVGVGGHLLVGSDGGRFAAFTEEGQKLWEYFAAPSAHGVHSTAAAGAGFACFGTYHGYVVCLDPKDGRPLWMRKVGDAVGASPLVVGDRLWVSVETVAGWPDGYVVALDLRSGALLWRSDYFGDQTHSSPALSENGELLFVGTNRGTLLALRARDGKVAWGLVLEGAIKSTPTVVAGTVFVTTRAGLLLALDGATGHQLWRVELGGSSQSSPTLLAPRDRLLVASDAGIFAVRLIDGAVLAHHPWEGPAEGGRMPSALALPDSVWIACGEKLFCRYSADGLRRLNKLRLGGSVTGMPWVQNGKLFVSTTTGGGIYRIE